MSQIEQLNKGKNPKEINKEENSIYKMKKPSQIISLQNKLKEKEKQIISLQEYISVLETKLKISKKNTYNYQPESNSDEYINKLKQEKEEILSQLKQEIILNDEQRNYIEILKQALESNIAKHGLTEKISFLQKKHYSKQLNNNCTLAQVVLDISKLKENNDSLIKQQEKNYKEINDLNTQKQKLEKNLNSFNQLNKEYTTLIENNNELQNELMNLKSLYNEKEKDMKALEEKFMQFKKKNEVLSNENNNLKSLRKDNLDLAKSVSDLGIKLNKLSYDNNNLKDFQTRYEILLMENNEIKKVNQILTDENLSVQNKLNNIEQYLKELENIERENTELKNNLKNLEENLNIIKNDKLKNENLYLDKIKNLTQENNKLENIINSKKNFDNEENLNKINSYINDNKKLYLFNKKLSEDNQKFFVNHKFITNLILRIIKFHVPNLNAKNIICEMINLNEKKIEVDVNIKKNEKNMEKIIGKSEVNFEDKTKVENEMINLKKEMNDLDKKINMLDNNLKEYEI